MTPEEFIAEGKRRGVPKDELRAKYEQLKSSGAFSGSRQSEPKQLGGLDKARAVAQNVASGFTFGFGDELAAAGSALGSAAFDLSEGRIPSNLGQAYESGLENARSIEEEFRETNPGISIGAEIVGSIANPINRITGPLGKGTGILRRAGQQAARGAAEGAVYGFGEGEGGIEERLSSGAQGGLVGGAVGGALSAGLGAASRRNVDVDVGLGDAQIPLNMAAPDSGIGKFYRSFVGNAIGGRGKIGEMERQAVRNNPKLRNILSDIPDQGQGTAAIVDEAKTAIRAQKDIGVDSVRRDLRDLRQATKTRRAGLTAQQQRALKKLNEQRAGISQTKASEISGVRGALRSEQAQAALPPDAPDTLKNLAANIKDVGDLDDFVIGLDDWWTTQAYGLAKQAKVTADDALVETLEAVMKPDDAATYIPMLMEAVDSGRPISGKFLMDIRNEFARGANRGSAYSRGEQRQITKAIDNEFRRLLKNADGGKEALEQFNRHNEFYGDKNDFMTAVKAAQAKLTPEFTERQLGVASRGRKEFVTGTQPSLQRARKAQDEITNIEKRASSAQDVIKDQEKALRKATEASRKELDALSERQGNFLQSRTRRLDQQARGRANRLEEATRGRVTDSPTAWSSLASTAALGIPFAATGPGAIAAGATTASILSQPAVQRLVAGQTRAQTALRNALESGDMNEYIAILARLAAQQGE